MVFPARLRPTILVGGLERGEGEAEGSCRLGCVRWVQM